METSCVAPFQPLEDIPAEQSALIMMPSASCIHTLLYIAKIMYEYVQQTAQNAVLYNTQIEEGGKLDMYTAWRLYRDYGFLQNGQI